MKRVFVDIYLAYNLGDDLFLDVLAKKYPNDEFTVNYVGNEYDTFIGKYGNVKRRKYDLKHKVLQKLKIKDTLTDYRSIAAEHDAILFIGGSIFRDEEYHEDLYNDRMKLISEFEFSKKPIFILGANFGPYRSEKFIEDYSVFFSKCKDVCFRDKFSYYLFKDMNNIRYSPDIVFQLNVDKFKENNTKDVIGFSIIDVKHKDNLIQYEDEYINSSVEAIELCINKGYKCCLMSFCEKEGDLDAINKIISNLSNMSKDMVTIYEYKGNLNEAIKIISEFKLFIAARFHANILAGLLGIPVLPVIYSSKTENMLKDINLDKLMIKMNNLKRLYDEQVIEAALLNKAEIKNIIEGSTMQFDKLSLFLEG